MRFSIIVPVYNIETWIEKCIDSILEQSFGDFELLLIDDGSTDESGRKCDFYATKDCRIVSLHKDNGGLSDARNYGIERARGEYLIFVDGDDYISEVALDNIDKEIAATNADVILSEGKFVVNEQQIQTDISFEKANFHGISGMDALLITTKIIPNWSAWGKCFRTEFWKEHAFTFANGRISEDFQLIDKVIIAAPKVGMVPAYYYYQYRSNSIVHSVKAKSLTDILLSMSEWKTYFDATVVDEKLKHQLLGLQAELLCHSVLGYVNLVDKCERKAILSEAEAYIEYLKYNHSMECKIIYAASKCVGVKVTCGVLGMVKRARLKRG